MWSLTLAHDNGSMKMHMAESVSHILPPRVTGVRLPLVCWPEDMNGPAGWRTPAYLLFLCLFDTQVHRTLSWKQALFIMWLLPVVVW